MSMCITHYVKAVNLKIYKSKIKSIATKQVVTRILTIFLHMLYLIKVMNFPQLNTKLFKGLPRHSQKFLLSYDDFWNQGFHKMCYQCIGIVWYSDSCTSIVHWLYQDAVFFKKKDNQRITFSLCTRNISNQLIVFFHTESQTTFFFDKFLEDRDYFYFFLSLIDLWYCFSQKFSISSSGVTINNQMENILNNLWPLWLPQLKSQSWIWCLWQHI
jgi:hypothetical protein